MTKPVIFGCEATTLSASERQFFRDAEPLGFILFARNCEDPAQIKRLVAELRASVGRADAPILIDQEGGRVARLKPPHFPAYPAAAKIAELGGIDARAAAWLAARLIADDLSQLGITVDCTPVLDLPVSGADPVIGDRAWGAEPRIAAENGLAVCDGLMAGGVLPVIKHIPGHGRATVDSHRALPVVETPREMLDSTDFAPFRALSGMPWAMTAHVLYTAIDADRPATLSPRVIGDVIRAGIGFDGVLLCDDLSMAALGGKIETRAWDALQAGCDLVLHCNGILDEMVTIAGAIGPMSEAASRRVGAAEARRHAPGAFDRHAAERVLAALLESGR
ncbi:MAG TPA: beta-N-acetylhexosaminidase [Stellaceae bacterium]